jgi:ubiquinol-cytochrome c reductase core subunit 2
MATTRMVVKVPAALVQQTRQVSSTTSQRAAQAAMVAKSDPKVLQTEPLKVTSQKNGLTVASMENGSPVVTLGVVIKAGSRNETYDNTGISHTLRVAAGLATKKNSSFGICRNLQQAGASLVCTQGREHTLYTIQTTRDNTDLALDYLTDAVTNQAFKPWELNRNSARLRLELAQRSPATEALELLHQAAYRGDLGNSLYSAPHRVGSHSTAALQEFVTKHFTTNRSALLGIGVSHSHLNKCSSLLSGLEVGAGPAASPSTYYGGEIRSETGGSLAYVTLATQCAGAINVADCVASMLLQRVLGMGSHVKYSSGQGRLTAAAASATSANCAVSALGQIYSDSGLLGAMVVSEAGAAGKAVGAVANAIRNATVTEEDVAAAKKNMLVEVYSMLEAPLNQIENIGSQVLLAGDVIPAEKVVDLISDVTTADVQAVAKKLSNASFSMGAVGNLSTVPHVDSL